MENFTGFGTITELEIENLSKKLSMSLPDDYCEFLLQYNGGRPTKRYLTFKSSDILLDDPELVVGVMFGFNIDVYNSILYWYSEYSSELPESSVLIGREDNSGFIVLINNEDFGKGVYYWDNAHVLEDSSYDSNVYKISDTFSEFMNSLILVE